MSTTVSSAARALITTAGVVALCGLLAASAAAGSAPQTSPGDPLDPRTYAPAKLYLTVHAAGVQRYTCQPSGTWLFTDPVANLYKQANDRRPDGDHFLDFATGRPVWRWKDGSSVEAARKAAGTAVPGSIPPLLLETVATTEGPSGDRLAKATWVQRLNTSGGVAPAGTCSPGAVAEVPYTAEYLFWKAKRGGGDD